MLSTPSLTTRVAIGKLVGFAVGIVGVGLLASLDVQVSWRFGLGVVFWYATLGAVIGVFGVYDRHPVLPLPLPWLMGAFTGAWLNLVLTLIAHDALLAVMIDLFGQQGVLRSPYWLVVEGALVGLLIGWLARRFGGYGPQTLRAPP